MKYRPIYDHVLAKQVVIEAKSTGGILLTSTGTEETTRATIVAVGTGSKTENGKHVPMGVNVGDVVTFSDDKRIQRISLDGEEFLIMKEECIVGIME